jgi:hypothetical protein
MRASQLVEATAVWYQCGVGMMERRHKTPGTLGAVPPGQIPDPRFHVHSAAHARSANSPVTSERGEARDGRERQRVTGARATERDRPAARAPARAAHTVHNARGERRDTACTNATRVADQGSDQGGRGRRGRFIRSSPLTVSSQGRQTWDTTRPERGANGARTGARVPRLQQRQGVRAVRRDLASPRVASPSWLDPQPRSHPKPPSISPATCHTCVLHVPRKAFSARGLYRACTGRVSPMLITLRPPGT